MCFHGDGRFWGRRSSEVELESSLGQPSTHQASLRKVEDTVAVQLCAYDCACLCMPARLYAADPQAREVTQRFVCAF